MVNSAYCQAMLDYIEQNDVDLLVVIQQIYTAGYNDAMMEMDNG